MSRGSSCRTGSVTAIPATSGRIPKSFMVCRDRVPRAEQRVLLGERAVDVLLLPGRPGPQRGLIEPHDPGGDEQGVDQLDGPGGHRRGLAQAGVDEPGRHLRARDAQIASSGTVPPGRAGRPAGRQQGRTAAARQTLRSPGRRAGGAPYGSSRTRTGAHAGHAGLSEPWARVPLSAGRTARRRGRRHHPTPALHAQVPSGEQLPGVLPHGPGHRRPRHPRPLAPVPLLCGVPFCLAPLLAGRLAARRVIP